MTIKNVPRISVITPSYNQAQYLEDTIRSVVNQGYPNLEYIVIDGGSEDRSVEIIQRYSEHLAFWRSEPDAGQPHALNEGLTHVTGQIVAFLNSDDVYLPGALHAVADWFGDHPESNWICGDTLMFGAQVSTSLSVARPPRTAADAVAGRYRAAQPGMFWRHQLLAAGFDTEWQYCFDHALYVRLLLDGFACDHLRLPIAAYRLHDLSKTIGSPSEFEDEFDAVGFRFVGSLGRWDRLRCQSVLHLRKGAGTTGALSSRAARIREVAAAALKYPPTIVTRAFWGSLRRALV